MSKSAFDLPKSAATLLAALARGEGGSSRHREADVAALVAADLAQRGAGGLLITHAAKAAKIMAFGPYPADGFFGSGNYKNFDAILAMYHDQGLAPFKALSFGKGVNYTAGLSRIRTSPDHGTGHDIAGNQYGRRRDPPR